MTAKIDRVVRRWTMIVAAGFVALELLESAQSGRLDPIYLAVPVCFLVASWARRGRNPQPLVAAIGWAAAADAVLDAAGLHGLWLLSPSVDVALALSVAMLPAALGRRTTRQGSIHALAMVAITTLAAVLADRAPAPAAFAGVALVVGVTVLAFSRLEATRGARHQTIQRMRRSAASERLIATVARRVLGGLEPDIVGALAMVVDELDLEGAFLAWRLPANGVRIDAAAGSETAVPGFQRFPEEWMGAFDLGHPFESKTDGRRTAVYPIRADGSWLAVCGFVAGDSVAEGFSDVSVAVAGMIEAAVVRRHARRELVDAVRAKDRLIDAVAHEMRTPLTAISGFASILENRVGELAPDELAEFLALIGRQTSEMSEIVEDLVASARVRNGSLSVRPERIDLARVVVDVLGSARVQATVGSKSLLTSLVVVDVYADPLRVRQILRNLLTNALAHAGDAVRVITGSGSGGAYVRVMDDGPGVPLGNEGRIFEPYFSAESRSTTAGAVGIGLTVSRDLARLIGGDVEYRRQDGWTVFELTLPAAVAARALTG